MTTTMKGECEHCLNKDKSRYRTQCKYVGDYPSRRAFVLSTFDAPCVCDAFDIARSHRTLMQRLRRVRCWLRGYHRDTPTIGAFRYDVDGMCCDCGRVGTGHSERGE